MQQSLFRNQRRAATMPLVHNPLNRPLLAILLTISLFAAACSQTTDSSQAEAPDSADSSQSDGQDNPNAGTDGAAASATDSEAQGPAGRSDLPTIDLAARPGPFQLTIDNRPDRLSADAVVEVLDASGAVLSSAQFTNSGVDESESVLIRDLPEGPAFVDVIDGDQRYQAEPITIGGEAMDDPSGYAEVELSSGYNYIPTRDGTTLSAFVTLPGSATAGPYPTIVEYSGYAPSDPGAATDPNRLLLPTLGFALVQVNVRGTGCSGGSFDVFERVQSLDGYDVIETVAAQPWSDKVGMFGVSYPGIMELHVASTRPPSLAAIVPFSVTDGVDSVLYPGGVYNNGFGERWTRQVGQNAEAGGQDWAADRVSRGDKTCTANQLLRVHNADLIDRITTERYAGRFSEERSARTFADQIEVPTLLAGAWQDEQTGGRFPELIDDLGNAEVLRAMMYNGLHSDAISGEMLVRTIEFLNLYVADRPATVEPVTRILISTGLAGIFGQALPLPDGRYDGLSPAEARAAFEAEPPIEILFEQGATASSLPVPSFNARFEQWPPAVTTPVDGFLNAGSNGTAVLTQEPPSDDATWSFTTEPGDGQLTTVDDTSQIWTDQPGWSWPESAPANRVSATSEPLAEDLVLVGNMSVDLWVSVAEATDAEIEVTVSEVHPDGSEVYVQAGWLQLSQRALAADATELRPAISRLESEVTPLEPGGEPVLARVEILPFAHVFREGSQLRITVDTPGASRPEWRFDVAPDPVTVSIHSSATRPSKVVLPVVPGIDVTTPLPACGALRGQPCRQG